MHSNLATKVMAPQRKSRLDDTDKAQESRPVYLKKRFTIDHIETPGLYPREKAKKGKRSKSRDDLSKILQDKVGDKARRRSSVVTFNIQKGPVVLDPENQQERRFSNTGDLIKNWRDISIRAKVEKELVVEKLDDLMKNLQMGLFEQAKRARNLSIKCMWLFLIVIMIVILTYELIQRGIQYYYNPVITTFTLHAGEVIDFPQVYICMAVAANRSFLLEHPAEFAKSDKYRERIVKASRKKREIQETPGSIPEFDHYLSMHQSLLERYRYTRQARQNESSLDNFDVYNFFHDAGFKVEETFLECKFKMNVERKLDCREIVEPILDINYGLCYAVKLDGMKQTTGGAGLTLILNSHADLYPTDDAHAPRSSGIYISISNQYDPTNWLKACAAPGQYAKVDLKGTRLQMMNLDSGSLIQPCIDDSEAAKLMRVFNTTYSRTACQMDCFLEEMHKRCQCILLLDKKVLRREVVAETEFCTPIRSQTCVVPKVSQNKEAQISMDECRSKCHTPCHSWRYEMRTSTAPLNPAAFTRFGLSPKNITDNLIRVDVAFSSIEYGELVQASSVTASNLIADIGGLLTLWMNASIVTIIGTLAVMIRYIMWKFGRLYDKNRSRN